METTPYDVTDRKDYILKNALSNSVMAAISGIVRQELFGTEYNGIDDADLEKYTPNKCYAASQRMAHCIVSKYGHLFTQSCIVRGDALTVPMTNYNNFHYVFICHGIDGKWYSASPANYRKKYPEYTLDILEAGSLHALENRILSTEGGFWPWAVVQSSDLSFKSIPKKVKGEEVVIVDVMEITPFDRGRSQYYYTSDGTFRWHLFYVC